MTTEEKLLEAIKEVVKEAVRDEVREQLEAWRAVAEPDAAARPALPTSDLDEAFNAVPAKRRKVG